MATGTLAPLGWDPLLVDAVNSSQFTLGTILRDGSGNSYMYVKSTGTGVQYEAGLITTDGLWKWAPALTTTTATAAGAAGGLIATPQMGTPAIVNQFMWVAVSGVFTTKFAVSCAQDVKVYTTVTAGVLDDASTTQIVGIKLITTITTAVAAPAYAAGFVTVAY